MTPGIAGRAFVSLASGGQVEGAYMLTADGLKPLAGAAPAERQTPVAALKEER